MAGNAHGALCAAAAKTGLSPHEYQDRLDQGLKYCWRCHDWHETSEFGIDRSRVDQLASSCRRSLSDARKQRYERKERGRGRRIVAARPNDKLQARRRVNYLVDVGLLANPNDLSCTDCGHHGTGPRHEYDHHMGYEPANHEQVEAVCAPCHHKREDER